MTILTRDQRSHDLLIKMGMNGEKCICLPDMVAYLKYDRMFERNKKVLLCLRQDKEKIIDLQMTNEIEYVLSDMGLEFAYTDTGVHYKVAKDKRWEEISKKLQEFAQCKLVITDRLHGMLLAAVSGTPCMFMDNSSQKVSGAYEWIKNLEYVKPLKDMECLRAFISQIGNGRVYHYNNNHLQFYYEKLAEIIKGNYNDA